MASKKKQAGDVPGQKELPALPFPVGDRAAFIRKAAVALDIVQVPTALVVVYSVAYDRVEVANIPLSEIESGRQWYVDGDHTGFEPAGLAKTHLSWLRSQALTGGATPEAIRLLEKATSAFSNKEKTAMAEKLKTKTAPKKGNAKALKEAATAAPVGGEKTAPKRKGNADALAKARAAKGPDTRKIVALKKPKEIEARAGSFRHQMLTDLLSSKTVDDFKGKGDKYDAGCIRYAVEAGYIKELPARA